MSIDQLDRPGSSEALSDSQWRLRQEKWLDEGAFDVVTDTPGVSGPVTIPFGRGSLVFSEPPPPWSSDLLARISELGDLEEGWDSYGACPVDPQCAVATVNFLFSMLDASTPKPSIVPTSRGGIQLEWHRAGADLEIEVESPARLHVFFEDQQADKETEATLAGNLEPLVPLLERLKAAP